MATANLLDTKTVNLNEILGNGKIYRVPQFQRDYSWEQDNWEDLWNDIELAAESKKPHYMGSVVLQSSTGKDFLIIDGQQRFSTLSILTLAIIDVIKSLIIKGEDVEQNKERIDLLMRQYIGHKDPASLRYTSKLFLNENNDGFYQARLLEFRNPVKVSKLSDSETLMWDAFSFFKTKVSHKFKNAKGADLATFLNGVIGELMMFIQITVQDELNAYTVFETLNSRGVELTSTDLLKNYLFSLVAKSDTDLYQVKAQWKKIIDTVGLKDFPAFLRYYLLATRRQLTKEYLFKELKNFVKKDQDVFDLLDQLEEYAYNYVALGNPDDELWANEKELRNAIYILKYFKVTQWKPLLMIAQGKLNQTDFLKLLQVIITLSFRYNVIAKKQTNEMEQQYSKAAISLYKAENPNLQSTIQQLKDLYVSDEDFKHLFASKQFNTNNSSDKKLLRYTLYKLEAQNSGGYLHDFEMDPGTIEHILPEGYPEHWQAIFTEEEFQRNIFLLGNLTLLEQSKNNKQAKDLSFEEKKIVYETSKYSLTNTISDPQWTSNNIKHRQAQLAKLATSIWKIQFQ